MRIKSTATRAMFILSVALAIWPPLARAAVPGPNVAEIQMHAWAKSLVPRLAGVDPAARRAALASIAKQLQADPYPTALLIFRYWLPPLMAGGHQRTVVHLALQGILAAPAYTGVVDRLLIFRIQALVALHKDAAALRNAKSLFNVCTMGDTGMALLILDQRLEAVYHKDPTIVRQFVREQRLGAKMPADATEPMSRSRVLASIQVHAAAYMTRLKSVGGIGIRALNERGNLLLLADKPAEALQCFRSLETNTTNWGQMLDFERSICRAIKAQDGTIGRANAYLLQAVQGSSPPQ